MKWIDRYLQNWRINKTRQWLSPGARVLDIGCADGALFQNAPYLTNGIGIDPDLPEPTSIGSNRLIPGFFPTDLPDSQPFDVITLLAVLEHVPPDSQGTLARDCFNALKPGGHVLITVPSPAVDHVLDFLRTLRLIDGMSLEQHYGYEVEHTPEIFTGVGLDLVKWNRFQLGLNNFFVFRRPTE